VLPARVRAWCSALTLAFVVGSPSLASAVDPPTEPWSDPDPPSPFSRIELGNLGFKAGAEYRANWLYVNPLSLNTTSQRRLNWVEHRLRLDAEVDYLQKVRIVASADIMDGVLWGDNGTYGVEPTSDRGTNVAARNPNLTVPCLRQVGPDPLDRNSYGYGLCAGDPFKMRRLYGEVLTPVGALRIGRQPVNIGTGIQASSGDGRPNRFGFSRQGNSVDRAMFATKPLEGLKAPADRNLTQSEGFFFITGYDRIVSDSPQLFGDDVQQVLAAMRLLAPTHPFGTDFDAIVYGVHRWDSKYSTTINAGGARVMARTGGLFFGAEFATNQGTTREIGEAYKLITNDAVFDQKIQQYGARAVLRYDHAPWAYGSIGEPGNAANRGKANSPLFTAYFEFDYASGDGDPQNSTPLTQFVFAEDSNVGLLLFKHTLAFQSARAAAVGNETLRRLGATSFPTETINTRGSFTNAVALFPQADFRPHPNLLFRGGVLLAWAQAPPNDPVASLQRKHGAIENDLVNFVGGRPGNYYGTELDGRIQWRYVDHFIFDLEGAVLLPGDALQDRDGRAVRSVLVQGRTTYVF
jgi:hypothetical protein